MLDISIEITEGDDGDMDIAMQGVDDDVDGQEVADALRQLADYFEQNKKATVH